VIVKTRAVVLREIKYRDQSKICTLFTSEFGKLTAILKGGRNPKSRLSGKFSAGNVLDIVLYKKNGRDIQLISDGSLLFSPLSAEPDMERFATMYRIIDLISQALEGEEKNLPLFSILSGVLEILYSTEKRFELLFAWFLLRMISTLGFEPSLDRCVYSGEPLSAAAGTMMLSELSFVMNPGGVALPAAALRQISQQHSITMPAYRLLSELSSAPLSALDEIDAGEAETEFLCKLLQEYCRQHLDHAPKNRNLAVVAQMLSK